MKKILLSLAFLFSSTFAFSQFELTEHSVNAVAWYKLSAESKLCYLQTYNYAKIKLDAQLKKKTKKKKAIVLDIDETILDNSAYQARLIVNNTHYTPETWNKWVEEANADTLAGALAFVNYAKSKGVEVFYISNRKVNELDATLKNLKKFKFPNSEAKFTLLQGSTWDKTERRTKVEADYDVVLFLGDNLTDFSENFANRKGSGRELINKYQKELLDKFIMFPNPMYGEWEKALYDNNNKAADSKKIKLKLQKLK